MYKQIFITAVVLCLCGKSTQSAFETIDRLLQNDIFASDILSRSREMEPEDMAHVWDYFNSIAIDPKTRSSLLADVVIRAAEIEEERVKAMDMLLNKQEESKENSPTLPSNPLLTLNINCRRDLFRLAKGLTEGQMWAIRSKFM